MTQQLDTSFEAIMETVGVRADQIEDRGWTIRQYPADGCSLEPNRHLHGTTHASISDAIAAIHAEVGDHGKWIDEAGYVCFHESDREGCGGFCIVRAY